MTFPDLETEALNLPVDKRAHLAERLLESLEALSEEEHEGLSADEEEHERLWADEALRRDAELDADRSCGRAAEDVFRDARARLR